MSAECENQDFVQKQHERKAQNRFDCLQQGFSAPDSMIRPLDSQNKEQSSASKHQTCHHCQFPCPPLIPDHVMIRCHQALNGSSMSRVILNNFYRVLCGEITWILFVSGVKRKRNVEKQDLPGTFPCQQCSKTFSRLRYLRKHVATHRTERKYLCDECGKGFTTKT